MRLVEIGGKVRDQQTKAREKKYILLFVMILLFLSFRVWLSKEIFSTNLLIAESVLSSFSCDTHSAGTFFCSLFASLCVCCLFCFDARRSRSEFFFLWAILRFCWRWMKLKAPGICDKFFVIVTESTVFFSCFMRSSYSFSSVCAMTKWEKFVETKKGNKSEHTIDCSRRETSWEFGMRCVCNRTLCDALFIRIHFVSASPQILWLCCCLLPRKLCSSSSLSLSLFGINCYFFVQAISASECWQPNEQISPMQSARCANDNNKLIKLYRKWSRIEWREDEKVSTTRCAA